MQARGKHTTKTPTTSNGGPLALPSFMFIKDLKIIKKEVINCLVYCAEKRGGVSYLRNARCR